MDTILQSCILATFFFQFQCPLSAVNIHPSPIRQCLSYVLLMRNWQLLGRKGCSNIYWAAHYMFSRIPNSQSQISDCYKVFLYQKAARPKIRQSTIYYAGLLGRWDKRIVDQKSDVPSIILFFTFYRLSALKTLYFYFCNFMKK